ncbi:MAG: ABC transporter substrate-binding protein [Xanthobacteraceae bacterium]
MRRRDFIKVTVGSAAAWPLTARAQQSNQMKRIGVLMPYAENDKESSLRVTALHEGLLKLGWTEGRNIRFEHRWSASDPEAIAKLAREIVDSRPDVILADTTPVTAAMLHETRTIPIVFVQVGDPVGSGFVTSFQHPGGNATGFNNFPPTLTSKWLELLMEIVPHTARVMYLFNPPTAPFAQRFLEPLKGAASSIGVEDIASPVHDTSEVEAVIAAFAHEPGGGLVVLPSNFMLTHRDLVITLAERYRLPTIYPFRYYSESGGLLSYGNVPADSYRQAATYIDQILRGAKPADLPVQMSVKFELVVNLKAAKAIGLKIPESFLVRADKVIE